MSVKSKKKQVYVRVVYDLCYFGWAEFLWDDGRLMKIGVVVSYIGN